MARQKHEWWVKSLKEEICTECRRVGVRKPTFEVADGHGGDVLLVDNFVKLFPESADWSGHWYVMPVDSYDITIVDDSERAIGSRMFTRDDAIDMCIMYVLEGRLIGS